MKARQCYLDIQTTIQAAPYVLRSEVRFDEVESNECYIKGTLYLLGDLELHIAEYVITEPVIRRRKYRYHPQRADNKALISRWDNVAHHPNVPTFPHHRHDDTGAVHASAPMDIAGLLDEILDYLPPDD